MIAASIAERTGYKVLGFLNDMEPVGAKIGMIKRYSVIGRSEDWDKYKKAYFFIAYVGMKNEQQVYEKILSLNIPMSRFATLIDPTAIIPENMCMIGSGSLIGPLAQLSPDTIIYENCIMLGNSFLGHDSVMYRFAHLTTNSVVGGSVSVGCGAHIGSNATIRENVAIGDFALVGSGSVVLKDVPANTIVAGNPAKTINYA